MNWKPIITDSALRNRLCIKIDEITEAIINTNTIEPEGLLTGSTGLCIYFAALKEYKKDHRFDDFIEHFLKSSFDSINQGAINSGTFCSGISGIMWALNYLEKENFLEIDFDYSEIIPTLELDFERLCSENNYDFLHGSTGIIYFLSKLEYEHKQKNLNYYLDNLEQSGEQNDNEIKWISELLYSKGNSKKIWNLSLSHGISSIIIVLVELYMQNPSNERIKKLVIKSINFLISQKRTSSDYISMFPSYIDETEITDNSRLGWCYGDMGNAIAIGKVGQVMNDKRLLQMSVDIMLHSANRKLDSSMVIDPGLCHGSIGIAHMFNRYFQATKNKAFQDASIYWINQTLNFENNIGIAGFQAHRGDEGFVNTKCVLDGIAGIGLALISMVSNVEPRWDRCMLIS